MDMKVTETIKQEKVDYFTKERDVMFETNILDSMELKVEPIKVEPHLYVSETNNMDHKCNLTKEAKIIENNDKYMVVDRSSNNKIISKNKGSEIKLESSEEMVEIEKMDEIVDAKWKIENEELNIKDEINIKVEEQGHSLTLVEQQKDGAASSSEKISGTRYFRCEHCEFKTTRKRYMELHLVGHTKPEPMIKFKCKLCKFETNNEGGIKRHVVYRHNMPRNVLSKCDQCDYQAVHKERLKIHLLKHKNPDKIKTFKCCQCEFQTVYKHCLKRHNLQHTFLKHKNPDDDADVSFYKCDHCHYATALKQSFERHVLKHKNK